MSRRAVLALLALGAVLVLVGTSRTWVTLTLSTDLGTQTAQVPGSALVPVAAAAGVVALAGTLAALVSRSVGRRVVGALVLVVTAAALVQALPVVLAMDARARVWWAVEVSSAAADASAATAPVWPALTLLGLVTVAVGAVALLAGASGWSGLSGRYEATATPRTDPWTALDRGEDPTAPSR